MTNSDGCFYNKKETKTDLGSVECQWSSTMLYVLYILFYFPYLDKFSLVRHPINFITKETKQIRTWLEKGYGWMNGIRITRSAFESPYLYKGRFILYHLFNFNQETNGLPLTCNIWVDVFENITIACSLTLNQVYICHFSSTYYTFNPKLQN